MRFTPEKLGATDEDKQIQVTIWLRRRPGHDPIPPFEYFLNCPPRRRLENDEFARRFGAHQGDINAVRTFCEQQGLTVLYDHAARRHVRVEGTVGQFNEIFGVTIHDHKKGEHYYHKADRMAVVPDHLSDIIIRVGLGEHPKDRVTPTGLPTNTPGQGSDPPLTPSTYQSLMGWPTGGAAGQTVAVIFFASPLEYSLSDLNSTCSAWGVASPSITTISVDGSTVNTTTFNDEWNMDLCMVSGFGTGAHIALYITLSSLTDVYARIFSPDPGDPVCNVTTESGIDYNEADIYVSNPDLAIVNENLFQDAAIQNITVCLPTGDFGSGNNIGDGKNHVGTCVYPYVLAIGGTVVGNISGNTFVEWMSNIGDTSSPGYGAGGGGGVSMYVPLPSYQNSSNVPNNTNTNAVGRGVPDISTCFQGEFLEYQNGAAGNSGGGTSQACPMTAGLIASINKSLGREIGFLNPTLYANATTLTRDINPSNSSGGPTNNGIGYFDINGTQGFSAVPGYNLANGWDPCVGLGVVKGNTLITYLQGTAETPALANITLNPSILGSGLPVGTTIGTLAGEVTFGSFTGSFTIAASDAPYLAITGNTLSSLFSFTTGTYLFGVTATQPGIQLSPLNQTLIFVVEPIITGITFTPATLTTAASIGTLVGSITVNASGLSWSGTLSLSGVDAASFSISGSNLVTAQTLTTRSYNINIVASQSGFANSPFSQAEIITPGAIVTAVNLSNTVIAAGAVSGTVVGSITALAGSTVLSTSAYTLSLSGTDAASFQISGSNLVTTSSLSARTYNINIVATGTGGSPFTAPEAILVEPTITGISLSTNSISGGSPSGTVAGIISVAVTGGTFSGTLSLTGTNASSFQISGTNLETQGVVNAGSYNFNIIATQSGAIGSPFTQAETVTVGPQQGAGTFTGTLTVTGANASNFQIVGTPPNASLATLGSVPAGSYNINIVATQSGATGSPFTQAESLTATSSSTNYQVSYGSSAGGPWTLFNTVSTLSDTITGLSSNTNYYFQVVPIATNGTLGTPDVIGPILTQTVVTSTGGNGTNFATSGATTTSVTLQMTAPVGVSGAITYAGQYRRICDFTWIPVTLGSSSSTSVSFTVSGLVANTAYVFRMNANGSRYSPPVAGTTLAGGSTASPDGTIVSGAAVQSSSYRITSSSGAVWTLLEIATPFQIAVNGTADATTSNVLHMIYSGGKVFYQNKQYNWFYKTLPTDTWTSTTDPRAGVPQPP